jgi:indolepyruvate ferredoxin oxidoreductase beta subunit
VISAVLLGTIAGAGVLPFPRQAFEGAIKRGGVGIKASLAAFTAGFEATTSGVATVRTPAANLPPPTLDGQDSDETRASPAPHKPIPAELLQAADRFPASARTIIRAGSNGPWIIKASTTPGAILTAWRRSRRSIATGA